MRIIDGIWPDDNDTAIGNDTFSPGSTNDRLVTYVHWNDTALYDFCIKRKVVESA